jgi:CelD/BcsL family acetyltransferase involved in cellulose biosynthesis
VAFSALSPSAAVVEDKNLECRVLTDFGELERFSTEWTRLQTAAGKGEIFQHFTWIQAWWHSLREDSRLFTPIVLRGGRIVGILPLVLTGRRLRFLGYSVSDYNHFLAEPNEGNAALEVCLTSLLKHSIDWNEIVLEKVPESSLLAECIQGLPEYWRQWIVKTRGEPCPTLMLGENRQETLDSLLSKDKLRKTVRHLGRRGKLTFRHLEDVDDIMVHLPQFIRQHIRRSALAGRRSAFLNSDYVSFYENLLERFDTRREIRFSVLELDGRAIAYHFGSLFRGTYLYYKPTFDVDLWDLSPGQALLWYLFEYLKVADVQEFDFGDGGESYKYRFSNLVHKNVNFTVHAPGFRSIARKMCRHLRESAKEQILSSPTLDRAAKAIRGMWQDLHLSYGQVGPAVALLKLLGDAIFYREESWVVSVDLSNRSAHGERGVSINEISLGGLADFTAVFPDFLTEDLLQKARELLRQKKTAWITSVDESEQTVLWTSVDTALSTPIGMVTLPGTAMLVLEIWPLTPRRAKLGCVPVLRHFATIADAMGLPMWAVCPKRLLPSERVLRDQGVKPAHQWVRTQILGKTHTKHQKFS